jgi:hypothetical protein
MDEPPEIAAVVGTPVQRHRSPIVATGTPFTVTKL